MPGSTVTGAFTTGPPPEYAVLTVAQVGRIASRDAKIAELSRQHEVLKFTTAFGEPRTWHVMYDIGSDDEVVAEVLVDDLTGEVTESWTGDQVGWTMARGSEGQFGHKLNAPYVWIPLCAFFLFGLLDWRRPFRLVHLDLLVLLAFGASHYFYNLANLGLSVPLVYPVLGYLLVRMLWIGFRGLDLGLRPTVPVTWLAIAAILLLGARAGLNAGDSGVIDVGYAGVIGADRIGSGEQLWGAFPEDNRSGDTYGPANYLAYVPFEAVIPWSGEWDDLPAAHAVAIFFDLATVAGLFLLGRRLRPGRDGQAFGVIMAFAWVAYPYTAFALQANTNDSLVAALLVWSLVAFARPVARGALLALAGMTKFAPLALAPLFAAGEWGLLDRVGGRGHLRAARLRSFVWFTAAFIAVAMLLLAYPAFDAGLAAFWERALASQIERESPFSIWGQWDSIGWLHTPAKALTVALAVVVAFVPRRRTLTQVAALGAAVIIALQIVMEHWFYLYIPWFLPLIFAALVVSRGAERAEGSEAPSARVRSTAGVPRQ